MHKFLILIPLFILLSILLTPLFFTFSPLRQGFEGQARADELEDVARELEQQKKQLSDLEKRKEQLAVAIASASFSLAQVSAELTDAEAGLARIRKELSDREKTLKQWETNRNTLIREFYKQSRVSPFEIVFSAESFLDSTRQLQYYQDNLGVLKENITVLTGEISTFKQNKAKAEQLKNDLAALRAQYQAALASSQRQLSSASSQLAQVKSSIKNLTAKQEQLILAKFAATQGTETVGDNPPLSEDLRDPTFSPAYMVATYGYPHRIGMSQYGAYGRALTGQTAEEILAAYYANPGLNKNYSMPATIRVQTRYYPPLKRCNVWSVSTDHGDIPFEDYLKGIREIPSSWSMEALKAQVVAARSYALARGSPICDDTCCQVWAPGVKDSRWAQAVDDTRGWVLTKGDGTPLQAFYHSTAGGYTISTRAWISYWNYNDGIKDFGSDGRAYEQIAGAPWYHTGWGSRNGTKGEYYPWMTEEESADIFNAFLLCRSGDQPYQLQSNCPYTQYLSPIDKDVNGDGVIDDKDAWRMSTVRNKLSELGITPVTSISAVVPTFPSGVPANTASVLVSGGHGTYSFSARYFRDMFNLRSRGTLQIPTYRFDFTVRQ